MKKQNNYPALKSKAKSVIEQKREELAESAEKYKKNINTELKNLKDTVAFAIIAAGTAYLTYTLFKHFTKNLQNTETEISIHPNNKPITIDRNQKSAAQDEKQEKKSSAIYQYLQKRVVSFLIDFVKEKIWDKIQTLRKKDAEKEHLGNDK